MKIRRAPQCLGHFRGESICGWKYLRDFSRLHLCSNGGSDICPTHCGALVTNTCIDSGNTTGSDSRSPSDEVLICMDSSKS